MTAFVEVAGVRVHRAQGEAFLVHSTDRWTWKGVSRNAALRILAPPLARGGRPGSVESDRFVANASFAP